LPDRAKFGQSYQKSLLSKKFVIFPGNIFNAPFSSFYEIPIVSISKSIPFCIIYEVNTDTLER